MPHIVQGGKHVFGISEVREDFQLRLPLEAYYEHRLHEVKVIVLISGSEEMGGFSIHSVDQLKHSRLSILLETLQYVRKEDIFAVPESSINQYKNRVISWMHMDEKASFFLSKELAKQLGIKTSDKLVVVRGGNNGPEFLVRGPIYDAAVNQGDIEIF